MPNTVHIFFSIWMKFFFLLTPFFVLSMFLSLTAELAPAAKRKLAIQVTAAVLFICFVLFFFGTHVFAALGITVDAFRIGAGSLLFLSGVDLVRGANKPAPVQDDDDIAVVPLAIPITVGPATTGALLVMGAESSSHADRVISILGLVAAIVCVGLLLALASAVERLIRKRGIQILSKLTGVVLAALAAQMVFTGIKNFLFPAA